MLMHVAGKRQGSSGGKPCPAVWCSAVSAVLAQSQHSLLHPSRSCCVLVVVLLRSPAVTSCCDHKPAHRVSVTLWLHLSVPSAIVAAHSIAVRCVRSPCLGSGSAADCMGSQSHMPGLCGQVSWLGLVVIAVQGVTTDEDTAGEVTSSLKKGGDVRVATVLSPVSPGWCDLVTVPGAAAVYCMGAPYMSTCESSVAADRLG
jgi:hypothetical protein